MKSFLINFSQLVFALLMYCMGTIFFGIALVPGMALTLKAWAVGQGMGYLARLLFLGLSVAAGYFLFGFSLIFLAGFVRTGLRLRLKEGNYPMFSWGALI